MNLQFLQKPSGGNLSLWRRNVWVVAPVLKSAPPKLLRSRKRCLAPQGREKLSYIMSIAFSVVNVRGIALPRRG
jgi:hypothetical protein